MHALQMRMHPGVVQLNPSSYRQRHRSAHLRQGELTGACGNLAILMAMIVLGIATKPYVRRLRYAEEGDLLMPLWNKVQESFFSGADHDEMLGLLDTVERYVHHKAVTGSMRKVLAFALSRLAENDVVILGFGDEGTPGAYHWALAVGLLSKVAGQKNTATAVLCLDAAEAAPTLAPYNAVLDLDSPKRGAQQLHYRGADGRPLLMRITSAIALSPR